MEVSGQLYAAPASILPKKESLRYPLNRILIPEPMGTRYLAESPLPLPGIEPWLSNPYPGNYNDGCAMAQAVSCRLFTAEAPVRDPVSPCGICGGQSGTGTGFLRILPFLSVSIITPCFSMLIYHLGDEQ
jgi:hypothetical protein